MVGRESRDREGSPAIHWRLVRQAIRLILPSAVRVFDYGGDDDSLRR